MPAEPTRGPASPTSPTSTAERARRETATAPAVGTATAPAVGTATAPAVGTATAPAVGTATAPAVGTATAPAVGTATAPAVGTATEGSAAPGGCTARIVTEPADARIVWGGKLLGQSPIEAARIPCGAATVVIEHERYQAVTREVTAEAGAAVVVSQRLRRPAATLIVNSSPPRAYVTVNDQMLGAAPRRLASSRFEQVSIRATFPGYLPWTKKIYLKEPTTTITAQLVPTGSGGDASRHPAGTR
jgi:PEGA domain